MAFRRSIHRHITIMFCIPPHTQRDEWRIGFRHGMKNSMLHAVTKAVSRSSTIRLRCVAKRAGDAFISGFDDDSTIELMRPNNWSDHNPPPDLLSNETPSTGQIINGGLKLQASSRLCTITTIVRMMECLPDKFLQRGGRESLQQECRADRHLLVWVCPAASVVRDGVRWVRNDSSTIETETTTKPQSLRPSFIVIRELLAYNANVVHIEMCVWDECFRICHFDQSSDAGGSIAANCYE
jgi:hypothetical protein